MLREAIAPFRGLFPTARGILLEHDLPELPLAEFRDVLIVGAGNDPYRSLFPGARLYVRTDIRPTPGRTDALADAHVLPFRNATFDCVLASEVLEHLRDPRVFAAEVARVLGPSGSIVLTVPFMFHTHGDPFDFWRPTREACRSLFPGFSSVEVYGQGNRLHVISDLLTTAGGRYPPLFPLRVLNHLLRISIAGPRVGGSRSSAPNGFIVFARR